MILSKANYKHLLVFSCWKKILLNESLMIIIRAGQILAKMERETLTHCKQVSYDYVFMYPGSYSNFSKQDMFLDQCPGPGIKSLSTNPILGIRKELDLGLGIYKYYNQLFPNIQDTFVHHLPVNSIICLGSIKEN